MGQFGVPPLQPGKGRSTINRWNFLGVRREVFDCITRQPDGLYKSYRKENAPISDYINGNPPGTELGFDCRSFTAAAIYALTDQLGGVCNFEIQYQRVGQPSSNHALLYVELKGCAGPGSGSAGGTLPDCTPDCCSGSFLYEPQSGRIYASVETYCSYNEDHCVGDKSFWRRIPIEEAEKSNTFGDPEWENNPAERDRITNVVCGCLSGNYPQGSAEAMIKTKCQDRTFWDWFKSNFSYEPGKLPTTISDMPQILSCKRVVCERGRSPPYVPAYGNDPGFAGGPMCTQPPDPENNLSPFATTPYQCNYECQEKWDCSNVAPIGTELVEGKFCLPVYSRNGVLGEIEDKDQCLNVCSDDNVCVHRWGIKYDCGTRRWVRLSGGQSFPTCLARDRFQNSSEWQAETDLCNYRHFYLLGEECEYKSSCADQGIRYDPPQFADPATPEAVKSLPQSPPEDCACGSWCVRDPKMNITTGGCTSGTLQEWILADRENRAENFNLNKVCSEIECSSKPHSFYMFDFNPSDFGVWSGKSVFD